jgi:hypothetical protein
MLIAADISRDRCLRVRLEAGIRRWIGHFSLRPAGEDN